MFLRATRERHALYSGHDVGAKRHRRSVNLYLNGALVEQYAGAGCVGSCQMSDYYIGRDTISGQNWIGTVGEVSVFPGILTTAQICQLATDAGYGSGCATPSPSPTP